MNQPVQSVCISVSPKAGNGAGRSELLRLEGLLNDAGIRCLMTSDIEELRAWGSLNHSRGAPNQKATATSKVVVAAGGDGTIALVANNTPPGVGILPMPMGTENLLARHFGYRSQASDTWERLRINERYVMDAGRLHPSGRLFLVMVSAGVDAEVVRAMHLTRRGHIQRWHYLRHVLRAF
ncbi:MAG: acylglycerol kinase family protein, partial [Planctomycetota bacterium]